MRKFYSVLVSITTLTMLLFSNVCFSQTVPTGTVNLGILTSFEGYTGAGAITTAAGANWTGDAGAYIGVISGDSIEGNVYGTDSITAQCRFDLMRLYIHLNDLFVDYPSTHAPAFGAGESISPGVYSIASAGSIGGALTLDGGGDPDAFFVIKYYGALTVGAGATIELINGTQSCNVFFIADGAISVAASVNLKGTLFSKVGAVGLGTNTILEGRMLTMEGAITAGAGSTVGPPPGTCTIPIFCETDCSPAPAVDVLGILSNYALYTNVGAVSNTGTSGINGDIGTDVGASTGYEASITISSFETANDATEQAEIDIDNAYTALMALPNTDTSHAAAFGSVAPGGETINAGVYFIDGAGSLLGTLFLDAQNDPDAIFVFKFAGAFGVAAQSKMILSNGARRCNVFFIGGAGVPTGAISIGAGAVLKGTFLSHGGACGSGASLFLAGRQLSTGGAVVTYTGIIYNNPECVTSTPVGEEPYIVIDAVEDTTDPVNGTTGGTTTSLTSNDTLNGDPVVIGTDPGNVILTGLDVPAGLTLIPDGTVTIDPNTPAGDYSLTYEICEVSDPTHGDSVTATIVVSAPGVALVKDAVFSGTGTLGDVITYTFTATNTGTTTVTNIVVTDPMVGLTITGNPIASLEAGASSSVITGTYIISQTDIDAGTVTNSALATAQDPEGNDVTDISGTAIDNDTPTVTSLPQTSTIALVKDAVFSGTGTLGDVITYTFTATNTGNTTMTNVVVTDPMVGLTLTGNPIASLEAGASSSAITGTYTITQTDLDAGKVTNSALATAQDPDGNDVTDISGTAIDNDTPTITSMPQVPVIALVKTAILSGTGVLGDLITYTFTVENTGNTTLTNVVVTDPMVGLIITGNPIVSLEVGASSSVITGTYTITQTDIDAGTVTNSAIATAQDPDGDDVIDTSGTANGNDDPTDTSVTQTSAIALVKNGIISGTGTLGDVITYIFTIENTGSTTLTDIVVTDPMIIDPIIGSPIVSLAPGATTIAMATYTITQSDIDAGGVTNTATATGQDPNGDDVTDNSGTAVDNDDPTVTLFPATLPDFTPTIDIDALGFPSEGSVSDFVVNISEVNGAPSAGEVVLKIAKGNAFLITYEAGNTFSVVNGGVSVDNNDWDITEDALFITMTLKAGVVIGANSLSAIGFTITRNGAVAPQTTQPLTVTLVNGSGLDSQNSNNTYNTVVIAQ
jgi:hypothetical protein